MSFQFKLKKKGEKVNLSKKVNTPVHIKSNPFNDEHESDEEKVLSIDSFDKRKGGALVGNRAVNSKKQEPLVIKPSFLNKTIKPQEPEKLQYGITYRDNAQEPVPIDTRVSPSLSREDQIRLSVLNNESMDKTTGLVIPIDNEIDLDQEDYENVPVEQFGAALLRGMGWKPDSKNKKTEKDLQKKVDTRKKGALLGIGAKAVESEVMDELVGKRGAKLEAPLIRKARLGQLSQLSPSESI